MVNYQNFTRNLARTDPHGPGLIVLVAESGPNFFDVRLMFNFQNFVFQRLKQDIPLDDYLSNIQALASVLGMVLQDAALEKALVNALTVIGNKT